MLSLHSSPMKRPLLLFSHFCFGYFTNQGTCLSVSLVQPSQLCFPLDDAAQMMLNPVSPCLIK